MLKTTADEAASVNSAGNDLLEEAEQFTEVNGESGLQIDLDLLEEGDYLDNRSASQKSGTDKKEPRESSTKRSISPPSNKEEDEEDEEDAPQESTPDSSLEENQAEEEESFEKDLKESEVEEEEETKAKEEKLTDKAQFSLQGRIAKEVAKRKELEESRQTLESSLHQERSAHIRTRERVEELEKQLDNQVLGRLESNPLLLVDTVAEVDKREDDLYNALKFFRQHREGYEGKIGKEEVTWTAEEVAERIGALEDERSILSRARDLAQKREQYDHLAQKHFPTLFDASKDEYRAMKQLLRMVPELKRLPNHKVMIAHMLIGEQVLKRQADKRSTAGEGMNGDNEKTVEPPGKTKKPIKRTPPDKPGKPVKLTGSGEPSGSASRPVNKAPLSKKKMTTFDQDKFQDRSDILGERDAVAELLDQMDIL